jgi:3-aminobutyryl-CoA ammonia-lyase
VPPADDSRLGVSATHRRYVPHSHAHYGGSLVDGAYVLGLFGDAATELCIRTDGDEGLFASYDDVQFVAAVQAGDVIEVIATVTRVGRRSRGVAFGCRGARSTACRHPRHGHGRGSRLNHRSITGASEDLSITRSGGRLPAPTCR